MNRADREFEGWLDRELPRAIAGELRSVAPARRPAYRAALGGRRPGPFGAVRLGAGSAAAVIAVVLAVASGGAALATGSPNPVTWGRHVVQAVSGCGDQYVGRCVRTPATPFVPASAPVRAPADRPESVTERPVRDAATGATQDSGDDRVRTPKRPDDSSGSTPKTRGHAADPTPAASQNQ